MSDDNDSGDYDDNTDLTGADSGRENRFANIPVKGSQAAVDHGRPPDAALDRIRRLQENAGAASKPAVVRPVPNPDEPQAPRPAPAVESVRPSWVDEALGKMGSRRQTVTVIFGAGEIDLQCIDVAQDDRSITAIVSRDATLRLQPSKELKLRVGQDEFPVTYLGVTADFKWLPFVFMAFVKNPNAPA